MPIKGKASSGVGKKKQKQRKQSTRSSTSNALEERKRRARKVLGKLKRLYPDADCALKHRNAFQLLVATILSAQSTDTNVNKVTPLLFQKYPDPKALAAASPEAVEETIRSTGFFRQKRKSIQATAQRIVEEFGGQVPDTMEGLTSLAGVARKTANVVLGTWFHKNEGVVVDTHIGRLADRLQLTWSSKNSKDAVRIEEDLMQVVPRREWTYFGHAIIWHGRRVCSARRPKCEECPIAPDCPTAFQWE